MKRLIFAENRAMFGVGALIDVGCEVAANMRMYVCQKEMNR